MGSMASPNSWSPYNNYRDCSTGICSVYCPQWCYIVFPPPPPSGADDGSGTNFSPLIISIIGILASAFLLIAYYTLISKYCKRRRSSAGAGEVHDEPEPTDVSHMHHHDQWQHGGPAAAATSTGLDQSLIESITVCCYKKEDGLLEEGTTECAVCLSEFQENEKIRLLPKCNHAFHVPCIDMWLKSHSNCPLCRANVVSSQPDPVANNASNFNVSLLRVQPTRDVIVVVEDPGTGYRTEGVVENRENGQEIYDKFRSPVSLGSFQCRRHLLVSDVLRISEEEEEEIEIEMGIHRLDMETGSSRGIRDENSMEGERSTSIGRLSWERPDYKGKNSVIPN